MNLYTHVEQNQKKLDFKIGVLRVQEPDLTPVSAVQDPLLSVIRAGHGCDNAPELLLLLYVLQDRELF